MFSTKKKGWLAEWVACNLVLRGYLIVERNFRTSFGELDIIAKQKQTFVIVEGNLAIEKLNLDWHFLCDRLKKKKKLINLANYYIVTKKLFGKNLRMVEKKFFWFSIKHYKNIVSLT